MSEIQIDTKDKLCKELDNLLIKLNNDIINLGDKIHDVKMILNSNPIIFKNSRKFDFEYNYVKFGVRSRYLMEFKNIFLPLLNNNKSIFAIITGNINQGKKPTLNEFLNYLKKNNSNNKRIIDIININYQYRKTKSNLLLKLVQYYQPNYPDRGYSIDEIIDVLNNNLENKKSHLIIVLEDVDIFLNKSGSDLIYRLSKLNNLSLIMLTNKNTDFIKQLLNTEKVNLFKIGSIIEFDKYSKKEIQEILNNIVVETYYDGVVKKDVIDKISVIVSADGDLRKAVELLWRAGYNASYEERSQVTIDDIKAVTSLSY